LDIIALGVKGGVSRRRERVVVCERRSVVLAFRMSRGEVEGLLLRVTEGALFVVVGVGFWAVEAAVREDWKCVRRSWVDFVRDRSAGMSAAGCLGFGGIFVVGYWRMIVVARIYNSVFV
jgi:hypothetical protein